MQAGTNSVTKTLKRFQTFRYALIMEGVLVGAFSGLVIVGFRILLEKASGLLHLALSFGQTHTWFIPLWIAVLLAAAVIVGLLLKWEPLISGSGIPQIEGEMQGELDQKWWRVLIAKCTGGLISIGCGLSLGREGPSIQLGAMTAKGFSKITKRVKTEEKLLITCGASAGLSAAFNAPIAGVLFSLEEIHKNFSPEVLLSTMASSITADFIARYVFGLKPIFSFTIPRMMPLNQYGHVIAMGVILGLFGLFYNICLDKSQLLYQKIPSQTVRLLIPFLCAALLGFTFPDTLGGGHGLMSIITSGRLVWSALCMLLFIKFAFSMVSFGSGAPGGIFLPLLIMGAITGSLYSTLAGAVFGTPGTLLNNFIILGMAGFFSAIVRAPITGILLICEMTGTLSHLLTLSIVSLFAYLIPDILHCRPVYDQLLLRLLSRQKGIRKAQYSGEKILVDSIIVHGSEAEGKTISDISWPDTCLVVSVMRGDTEFVPKGDTAVFAGDRIVLLCDESVSAQANRTLEEKCRKIRVRHRHR